MQVNGLNELNAAISELKEKADAVNTEWYKLKAWYEGHDKKWKESETGKKWKQHLSDVLDLLLIVTTSVKPVNEIED